MALPYTVMAEPDIVRLVAGEDHRYTLKAAGLESWLPGLLAGCDGRRTCEELLAGLDDATRQLGRDLIERLYGERVLVSGPVELAHHPAEFDLFVEGGGPLAERLATQAQTARPADSGARPLPVFCQDRLDYAEALAFNTRCRREGTTWLWATTGPMSRGYVSPPFVPAAGPCLACLIGHFRRLSPAPELYDALIDHAGCGRLIVPAPFPATGLEILAQIVLWKLDELRQVEPHGALFRLHVLELETMEISSHRVLADPACPACGDGDADGGRVGS
jgi:bacteriocin biosynthesis cyclodehydratase domain-containing protein